MCRIHSNIKQLPCRNLVQIWICRKIKCTLAGCIITLSVKKLSTCYTQAMFELFGVIFYFCLRWNFDGTVPLDPQQWYIAPVSRFKLWNNICVLNKRSYEYAIFYSRFASMLHKQKGMVLIKQFSATLLVWTYWIKRRR